MPAKLMRCVHKVQRKKKRKNAWAICTKATGLKPYKKRHRG